MFAIYHYKPNSNYAQILSDIRLIYVGVTDPQLLSDSCIKERTQIISEVPAGWQAHDDNPGVDTFGYSGIVIKSPYIDNQNKYKYLRINIITDAASGDIMEFYFSGYEYWDNVSHAGINSAYSPVLGGPKFCPTRGGIIYLASSERFALLSSFYGSYFMEPMRLDERSSLISEHSREHPWCTVDFPAFCVFSSVNSTSVINGQAFDDGVYISRAVDVHGNLMVSDLSESTPTRVSIGTIGSRLYNFTNSGSITVSSTRAKVNNNSARFYLYPLFIYRYNLYGPPLGWLSHLSHIYAIQPSAADYMLAFKLGGLDYIVMPIYFGNFRLAVRYG